MMLGGRQMSVAVPELQFGKQFKYLACNLLYMSDELGIL